MHYQRMSKHGSTDRQNINKPAKERFWAKVIKTDKCWLWIGALSKPPYGTFQFEGRVQKAHRVSWILAHGPIPRGMNVLHDCDNPPCVRPSHLFLGTHQDNADDMIAKGRHADVKGEKHPRRKLSAEAVRAIRQVCSEGVSQSDAARRYGVNHRTVHLIVHRKTWTHI